MTVGVRTTRGAAIGARAADRERRCQSDRCPQRIGLRDKSHSSVALRIERQEPYAGAARQVDEWPRLALQFLDATPILRQQFELAPSLLGILTRERNHPRPRLTDGSALGRVLADPEEPGSAEWEMKCPPTGILDCRLSSGVARDRYGPCAAGGRDSCSATSRRGHSRCSWSRAAASGTSRSSGRCRGSG